MTEKELRKALLGVDAEAIAAVPDAHEITRRVLQRDRRRVRILAGLTIFLWSTAALGIVLVLLAHLVVHPHWLRNIQHADTAVERAHFERIRTMMLEKTTAVVVISVAVLTLAALGTVFLVFASHAATIRQVNATLVEISAQLRQLKQSDST